MTRLDSNKIIIIAVFAIVIYVTVILFSDTNILFSNFSNLKYDFLLYALLLFSVAIFLYSLRWFFMLRSMKIRIPLKNSILIYFTGYAFLLTPGKLGESIRSKYLRDDFGITLSKSVPTVFAERYYDVIAIITIVILSYGISEDQNFYIFFILSLLFLFYFLVKKNISKKIFSPLKSRKNSKIIQRFLDGVDNLEILLKPKIFLQSIILTIIPWSLQSLGAYFIFNSFEISVSVSDSAFFYVISSLVGAATFLPGGIGSTEGSLIGLFLLQGYEYDIALGPVLMLRVYALWYPILIGIFFMFFYRFQSKKIKKL